MRRSLLLFTVAALFTVVRGSNSSAQSHEVPHEIPLLNSCIREFYDPGMYNYLTYKNTCAQAVTIVYVAKDNSGFTGTMELRAGAQDSIGRSVRGTVPRVGEMQLYVCQQGYLPMGDDNKVITKPQATFQCQLKPDKAN